MSLNCFSGTVSETCEGTIYEFTDRDKSIESIKSFFDQVLGLWNFGGKLVFESVAYGQSYTMAYGINALRCFVFGGFDNLVLLLQAAYFTLAQVGLQTLLEDNFFNAYAPLLCTCNEDFNEFGGMIKNLLIGTIQGFLGAEGVTNVDEYFYITIFSSCSEAQIAINFENTQDAYEAAVAADEEEAAAEEEAAEEEASS